MCFGECSLSPSLAPGDPDRVVGDLRVAVKPPVDDGALVLGGQAAVSAGEVLDHRVDASFQGVRCRFQDRRTRVVAGGEGLCDGEVVEQVASSIDGEQAVVGFAHPVVGPGPASATWGGWVSGGLLVEVVGVDGAEVVQAGDPGGGLAEIGDAGEFECEAVERCAGGRAGTAGGVTTDGSLDVDEAALHCCCWPEGFDGGLGALAAVGGDQDRGGDAGQEFGVGGGGFPSAPVPVDDVGGGGGDQQAAAGEVGAVDEDLVVDPVRVGGVGYLDVPAPGEASLQGAGSDMLGGCDLVEGLCAGGPVDERSEFGSADRSGLGCSDAAGVAGGAAPAGGSFGGGAVFLHGRVADGAAGSVGFHPCRFNRERGIGGEHTGVVLSRTLGE